MGYRKRREDIVQGKQKSIKYQRLWALPVLVPLLGGCLTMEIIGEDISDSSTATIACSGDGAGTISFAVTGDGTVTPPGPVTLTPPKYRAITTYTPVAGTGLSRDNIVRCTFAKAAGGAETAQGTVVVRETLQPEMLNLTVPAFAKSRKAFEVKITVQDPKNAGAAMVGWVSGIDTVSMSGTGDVRAVPVAIKDYPGVPPGPPTHARGEESPPEITFIAECMRVGSGSLEFTITDTAGNTLLPIPEAFIECTL